MLNGMKVAILVADGFEQAELAEPKKALEEQGAETRIVSPAKGEVQGWKHFDHADTFRVDVPLEQDHILALAADGLAQCGGQLGRPGGRPGSKPRLEPQARRHSG